VEKTNTDGPECVRLKVEKSDPLYPDVQFLQKWYRNPEMVREAIRRLAQSRRAEEYQISQSSKASA
jgi:hypothetical protein